MERRKCIFRIVLAGLIICSIPFASAAGPDPYFPVHMFSSQAHYDAQNIRIGTEIDQRISNAGGAGYVNYTVYGGSLRPQRKIFRMNAGQQNVTAHAYWNWGELGTLLLSGNGYPTVAGLLSTVKATENVTGHAGSDSFSFNDAATVWHYSVQPAQPGDTDQGYIVTGAVSVPKFLAFNSFPCSMLESGTSTSISWRQLGFTGTNVKLDLYRNSAFVSAIARNLPATQGSYTWSVPAGLEAGGGYQVVIQSLSTPAVYSYTDDFWITHGPPPAFMVSRPNGGEYWKPGTTYSIDYETCNDWGNVNISLFRNTVYQYTIYEDWDFSHWISWYIPPDQAEGSDYRIEVRSVESPEFFDRSDGSFTISATPPPPVASFTAVPRSGAAPLTVRFTDISTYAPASWKWNFGDGSAVNSTQQNPVHTYTRPGSYSVSLNVSNANGFNRTTKIRYVNVTSPILVVVPNGGQNWAQGSRQNIRWNYSGTIGPNVRLDLMKGATVHHVINASTPAGSGGSGSYPWKIPYNQVPATDYRIRITSTGNSAYTDTSNKTFSIRSGAPITVTSPNGGQTWIRGSARTIRWSYTGNPGSFVKIELLKGGAFNRVIAQNTSVGSAGTGSKTWVISSLQQSGTDYRVRITSLNNKLANDTGNADFTISA